MLEMSTKSSTTFIPVFQVRLLELIAILHCELPGRYPSWDIEHFPLTTFFDLYSLHTKNTFHDHIFIYVLLYG